MLKARLNYVFGTARIRQWIRADSDCAIVDMASLICGWGCEGSTTACGRAIHMTTADETTFVQRMLRIPRGFEEFDKVSAHIAAHTGAIKQQGSSRSSSKFVFVIIHILITPEHV